MSLRTAFMVTLALMAVPPAAPALADDSALVTKKSPYSVAETLDRFTQIITGKGLTVFARIDHAAGAEKVGQMLAPNTVLVFGNPKVGTPLIQANPQVGLSLPLKLLAYEDADGQVWLAYLSPHALKTAYGLEGKDGALDNVAKALANLTDAAVKAN